MTTQPQWAEVEAALDAILSLPPSDWRAACRRLAGDSDELHRELMSLLACVGGFDPVLDRPPAMAIPAPEADASGSVESGARIGAYRVLDLIGRGGMGEVYVAERADGQFEQRVALKFMKREAIEHLDRFQGERQILARLEHPGIARLLDGGLTDDGRPYMVMELVIGQPILEWCSRRRCDLTQRLRLFAAICDAVAYAHRNLIVHRDLKPANVLVTADGVVKLLDFGVAKALQGGASDQTQNAPLTPAYAAPEQLTCEAVTTATDVYALGLVLFELLAGERPWHLGHLPLAVGLEKVLREPAPRVSERAARVGDAPVPAALLRGDLDAIVAKALRKEPEHRYETVAAFQLDVDRSQRAEPVAARSHARLYVFNRFLRRHRVAAATVAFVLILMVGAGIAVMTQERRATREAARATATRNFLVSVFDASDPRRLSAKPRGQITAKELLDANSGRIDQEFAHDPDTHIELLGIVSAIYRELGEIDRYATVHLHMLDLARRQYGRSSTVVLDSQLDDAEFAAFRQDYVAASQELAQLDPLIHEAKLDRSRWRARWWLVRAMTLTPDSNEQAARVDALQRGSALFAAVAPHDRSYVTLLSELGSINVETMKLRDAVGYFTQAIAVAEHVPDRNDAELQTIYSNMAIAQQQNGDYAAADASFTKSEAIAAKTYGQYDRYQWVVLAQHAHTLHLMGARQRALSMFASLVRVLPPPSAADHDAAFVREQYGNCLAAEGRPLVAIPLIESALSTYAVRQQNFFEVTRARQALGNAYELAGRVPDARAMLQQSLDARIQTDPPAFQALLGIRERWGRFLLMQGDFEGAKQQFLEVVAQDHGRRLSHVALAYGGLARVALSRGDTVAATQIARQAIDLFGRVQGYRDVRNGPYLWHIYAQALLAAGNIRSAREWAQRSLDADLMYDDPSSAEIAQIQSTLRAAAMTASR